MADFVAVLRKAIEALKENTPEAREKIYEKARATIEAKLAAATPPPSPELAARQNQLLEDAIAKVEAEQAPPPAAPSQRDELEELLAELNSATWEKTPEPQAGPIPPLAAPNQEPVSTDAPQAEAREAEAAVPDAPQVEVSQEETFDRPAENLPDFLTATRDVEPAEEADVPAVSADEAEPLAGERPDEPIEEILPPPPGTARPARRGTGRLVAGLLVLVLLVAVGVGAWIYRDDLARIAGLGDFGDVLASFSGDGDPADQMPAETPSEDEPAEAAREPEAALEEATPAQETSGKFTQRLLPDGREVDEGPAGGEPALGEGTSIAAATQGDAVTDEAADETEEAVSVGQRAIFYEERTSTSEGSANDGSVVWSIAEEAPGNELPPEPVIRAEATIPGHDLQLRMTIRRNTDQSLPASHIIELIFLTPDDFPGGGINNVSRIAMKRNEQDAGSPLLGIPAKIADGFFLVALSDRQADIQTNSTLMMRENWIDIPLVYASGRRALITLEKGVPGERIFREALESWRSATSG